MIRLLILVLALPINAIACSCGNFWGTVTIKDYNGSAFILSGKAIKVTINKKEAFDKQRQIEFQVDEIYKGEIESKTVMIYTSLSDASCGLFVKENEEWIIWAYLQNNVITTNLCTRSRQKKHVSEHDLKFLKYFKSNPLTYEWRNESGNLIAVGKLRNNMPVGHWRYYYTNGYTESEAFYKNGKYDGKRITYYPSESIVTRLRDDKQIPENSITGLQLLNKIREVQNYKDGIRDGEFVYYASPSIYKPQRIVNYKNGGLDGKSIGYYDNGIIYYEQTYKEGKLEGYERFYYQNGQLKQEGKFVQGKATGEFKQFSETGELIKTTVDKRPDDKD